MSNSSKASGYGFLNAYGNPKFPAKPCGSCGKKRNLVTSSRGRPYSMRSRNSRSDEPVGLYSAAISALDNYIQAEEVLVPAQPFVAAPSYHRVARRRTVYSRGATSPTGSTREPDYFNDRHDQAVPVAIVNGTYSTTPSRSRRTRSVRVRPNYSVRSRRR